MLLLVGLGNPSPNNSNNRHNVGFTVIDAINSKFKLSKQKPKFKGLLTTGNIDDKKVYAIKPLTFMNSSGICIKELIEYFRMLLVWRSIEICHYFFNNWYMKHYNDYGKNFVVSFTCYGLWILFI